MAAHDDADLNRLHQRAIAPFREEQKRLLPRAAKIIDAHTHLGLDEDGRSLDLEGLLALLEDAGASKACVFPLHDPDRKPSYAVPNDKVLAAARESDGKLIPFCRLDPAEGPVAEANRCLDAGAKGIKLHPRAQAFGFESAEMEAIFQLAEDAKVPILIHAGRGMQPIADGLLALAWRHPCTTLILAHGAICDQAIITSRLADHPRVLYDTSSSFPTDVLELLARAPAERIVFASDPPYGLPAAGLYLVLRVAAQAGLQESALRGILGETIERVIAGEELLAPQKPPRGRTVTFSGQLACVFTYVGMAGPALFGGMLEQALAMVEMASAACRTKPSSEDALQAPHVAHASRQGRTSHERRASHAEHGSDNHRRAPSADGEAQALETIGFALQAVSTLLRSAERNSSAVKDAIGLIFRSLAYAATLIPDSPSQPDGRPFAAVHAHPLGKTDALSGKER